MEGVDDDPGADDLVDADCWRITYREAQRIENTDSPEFVKWLKAQSQYSRSKLPR